MFPAGSSDPFGGSGDQLMRRVIAGGPGVVAVGSNGDRAAVWTFDGTGWTPQASSVFGMAGHAEEMWSVAILNGTIVAVGDDRVGDHQVAAAWFSPDQGLSWHRAIIRGGTGNGDQQMTTVVQAGPGLVAVGYDTFSGDENAAVWTSTDGRAWDEVQDPDFGGPGRQEMKGVIPVDGNVVAVGIDTTGSDQNGAVWISPNGETWTKHDPPALGGPAVQQVKSVVQVGQRLIAVGRDRSDTQDENAAVWVATVRPA
jgi:hypothetical protein